MYLVFSMHREITTSSKKNMSDFDPLEPCGNGARQPLVVKTALTFFSPWFHTCKKHFSWIFHGCEGTQQTIPVKVSLWKPWGASKEFNLSGDPFTKCDLNCSGWKKSFSIVFLYVKCVIICFLKCETRKRWRQKKRHEIFLFCFCNT